MRAGLLLPLLVLAGCDFSQWSNSAQNAAQQAQQTATETAAAVRTEVQEQTGQAGGAELTLGSEPQSGDPTPDPNLAPRAATKEKSTACYVVFTPQADGRQSVLALQSYKTAEREAFPSFYIHAAVAAATLEELAGQTVPARMYLQSKANGPTFFSPDDAPLQLRIAAVEGNRVTAEITGGSLTSASDATTTEISGQFTAVAP